MQSVELRIIDSFMTSLNKKDLRDKFFYILMSLNFTPGRYTFCRDTCDIYVNYNIMSCNRCNWYVPLQDILTLYREITRDIK